MNSSHSASVASAWQQLVHLGERFLNQPDFESQQALVRQFAEEIVDCEAELWLSEHFGGPNSDIEGPDSPLMQSAILSRNLAAAADSTDPTANVFLPVTKKGRAVAAKMIAAPLVYQDTVLGAIQFSRTAGSCFSKDEIEILQGLTAQAAIAFQAAQQITFDRRRLELLSLVRRVSAQIAEVLDPEQLSHKVTRLIQETFDYYYVAIFTCEEGQSRLRFRDSARRLQDEKQPLRPFSVAIGQGIIGHAASSGEEIMANDVTREPYYRELDALPETRSEVSLPLKIEGRVLGVLDVQSDQLNAFSDLDMLVLRSLADHVATAFENARLYGDVQRRVRQLASVAEISNAISSILEEDALLREVTNLLRSRLGYPGVHIYVVHPVRRKVICKAGYPTHDLEQSLELDSLDNPISLTAHVGETSIMQIECEDLPQDERFCTQMVIPLKYAGQVLGVLDVRGNSEVILGQEDLLLLEALADNIAVAMRNSMLYRSELWRRKVAESMREVAGLLTADADLEQVLQVILGELERTLPIDAAAIWLLENGSTEDGAETTLRMAAVNISAALQSGGGTQNDFSAEEIMLFCNQTDIPSHWLLESLDNNQPLIRHKDAPYEPLGAILDFPVEYSAIVTPLRVNEQPIGLLVLVHHTEGRYGQETQNMTATFASYAAVAIENTRLYESAHDQAWVSTVLLQVAEATQSLNTLDELLGSMAQITPSLIGVNSCSIFLWNHHIESFVPAASYVISGVVPPDFRQRLVRLGELPAFDQLFFSKSAVVIDQQQARLDVEIYPAAQKIYSMYNLDLSALVVFPMLAHGDVLGLFLVDYHLERAKVTENHTPKGIRWEEKFIIIQGVAHQTAVAVENLQLLKAQQEEAYVSVALLQVAQAVVSLNALDETLEAIVRLTPILIGVKRCVIFLWNEEYQSYKLAGAYGLQKKELLDPGEVIRNDEFSLLELVRMKNQMAVHALRPDTEHPNDWLNIDQTDCEFIPLQDQPYLSDETSSTGQTSPQLKRSLRTGSNLLFGFPLTVKGKVLGVMLTQEMDKDSGWVSAQTREKRHEISLGIIQQAALAIQNDLLQREVLMRERLEREFQLARQIQQTFLPDHLPQPSGWELNALWRPALQVSGDFYDIFELPGQKLGIVIADVADKGMPAALFMTLIRTLIRATVREILSPAEALARVNNLLIPDTRNGMFVTVAYVVVSLESGEIQYANAGHNPPLMSNANGELRPLTRTGMALGVLEDIPMQEHRARLEPGDYLIFYTDGITEAFSADNDMFGEERLRQSIQANLGNGATHLIGAIDQTVSDFLGDAPFSDDLTLLVLSRRPQS